MTTFATSHTSFSNMQGEDFMEVSNDPDRNNAMTMEEDNYDIDLDLGDDVPELNHEDSMMDDDEEGQNADQDLQMDEDYQDQDDEILDYVDDEPAILEVPMTEENAGTQQEQEQNTHIQSLPNPDVVPETPAFASFTSQPSLGNLFAEANKSQDAQPDAQVSQQPQLISPEDDVGNLESIRSLYDAEPGTSTGHVQEQTSDLKANSPPAAEQTGAEEVRSQEPGNGLQLDSKQTEDAHDPNPNHDDDEDAISPFPEDEPEEDAVPHFPEHEPEDPSTTADVLPEIDAAAQPEQDTQDPATELPKHEEETTAEAEPEDGHDEQFTNYPEAPLPCLVTYREHQMSLFPPLAHETGTPETFLLPDSSVFDQTINTFLDNCHNVLTNDLEKTEDLEVAFPCFNFKFRKHDPEASSFTLRHIAELSAQFQQNDGVDTPEPLHIQLLIYSPVTARMNYLYDLASEGKGLKYVEELLRSRLDEDAGPDVDEYDQAAETNPDGPADEEHDWAAEGNEHHEGNGDEDADAGVVEDGHNFDDSLDNNEGVTGQSSQTGGLAEANGIETSADADPSADVNSYAIASESNAKEDIFEGDGTGAALDGENLGESAQTAEEIDFDDDEWAQNENTNTDTPGAADAQQEPHVPAIEPSQSWHSATQPDTAEANNKDPVHEPTGELDIPDEDQPDPSNASSVTVQGATGDQVPDATQAPNNDEEEEEDIFADEDTYTPTTHHSPDDDDDVIDFGDDDEPAKSPSLKRIRSEVDKVGGEADPEEGDYIDWDTPTPAKKQKLTDPAHPLKRSRSDIAN